MRCVCGCGRRGRQRHHVVYCQELRRVARQVAGGPPNVALEMELERDARNLVWVAVDCHAGHHARSAQLPLRVLPDSVFEFAAEVLGAGPAYEYLRRRYAGEDPRLEALV